jgi:hypothetical protein
MLPLHMLQHSAEKLLDGRAHSLANPKQAAAQQSPKVHRVNLTTHGVELLGRCFGGGQLADDCHQAAQHLVPLVVKVRVEAAENLLAHRHHS